MFTDTQLTKSEIEALNIDAATVNNKTVEANVPSNAVFTDTNTQLTKSDIDALGVDAGTVNNKTVEANVPSNAVFTDTQLNKAGVEALGIQTVGALTSGSIASGFDLIQGARIGNLNAGKITSGIFPVARGGTGINNFSDNDYKNDRVNKAFVDALNVDAGTVNNKTVLANVPSNAVFTDTQLSIGTGPGDALAGNTPTISTAQSDKLGYISVTGNVDLDDVKTKANGALQNFSGLNDSDIPSTIARDSELPTRTSLSINNVDNTSDTNKPVSTAQQTALNAKASLTGTETLTNKTFTDPNINGGVFDQDSKIGEFDNIVYGNNIKLTKKSGLSFNPKLKVVFSGGGTVVTNVQLVTQDNANDTVEITMGSNCKSYRVWHQFKTSGSPSYNASFNTTLENIATMSVASGSSPSVGTAGDFPQTDGTFIAFGETLLANTINVNNTKRSYPEADENKLSALPTNSSLQSSLNDKLNLSGGALTGPLTTNSTIDGVDIATRDAVLTTTTTTANAAMPISGGQFTGNITMASGKTIDGVDITNVASTANSADSLSQINQTNLANKMPKAGGTFTGAVTFNENITIGANKTIDGVNISARDAVLTSTKTTADAAMPKAGGTFTGSVAFDDDITIASGKTVDGVNLSVREAYHTDTRTIANTADTRSQTNEHDKASFDSLINSIKHGNLRFIAKPDLAFVPKIVIDTSQYGTSPIIQSVSLTSDKVSNDTILIYSGSGLTEQTFWDQFNDSSHSYYNSAYKTALDSLGTMVKAGTLSTSSGSVSSLSSTDMGVPPKMFGDGVYLPNRTVGTAASSVSSGNTDLVTGGAVFAKYGSGGSGGATDICLLYTSPSPRDVEESRMPSSA